MTAGPTPLAPPSHAPDTPRLTSAAYLVQVTIIDDDNPGVLDFHEREIHVQESAGDVGVRVVRTGGSKGKVSCTYRTVDGTAIAGADYKSSTGTLVFGASGPCCR